MKKTIQPITNDTETTPEILASEIEAVAKAARALLSSRLQRRAVLVLIKDSIRNASIGIGDIGVVLDAAATLDVKYLRPAKA